MKPLIVIVEGPDRCGKGSFIEILRDNISNSKQIVIHSGKPPKKAEDKRDWALKYNINMIETSKILSNHGNIIILDRSYLGEYVYGPLYRNIDYKLEDFKLLEKMIIKDMLNTHHIVLISFTDSVNNVINRDDGNSHITTYEAKSIEHTTFKHLHAESIIKHKHLVDWSTTTFSVKNLQFLTTAILNTWRTQ